MNNPKIRFKGYTETWEQRKLGEVFEQTTNFVNLDEGKMELWSLTVEDGLTPKSERYNREFLVKKDTNFKEVRPGDIVYNPMNMTLGAVGYNGMAKSVAVSGYYTTMVANAGYDSYYINTWLKSPYAISLYKTFATGSLKEKQRVQFPTLSIIPTVFPESEEQKKIGQFFERLDNLITLHQRKCDETKELKKFMLQKMFPKNDDKKPELRFKRFTDDWEQRKLGHLCERVTRKNKNNESDLPLTIASQYGLIDQRDFFNKVVAAKDISNYYLLKKGEFAYNKSYSNGFDYGSVKRLNAYEQGCLSTLYICFGITSDEVESDYLECFFDTLKWYGDVSMICAEGARNHGLLNVDTKGFFDEVTIDLPKSLEEQKKISAYLNALDNLVTLHQRKCEKLKELKKYMLQNMFAQT